MLDEILLISASKAARGITNAQANLDEAKRRVEEAKADVEVAKNGVSEAKAAYDAVIAEIAGTGLSASKARKAVEDMLRIFADVGIISGTSDEAPSAEPKPARRKKAEQPAAAAEAAAPTEAEIAQTDAAAVETETTSEVVVEAATEEPVALEATSEAPAEGTAVQEEVPVEQVEAAQELVAEAVQADAEIDNGEVIGEIYEYIETATENEDISVSETLITLLNAADWYSREHRNELLSIDLYREILNIDFVNEAAATDGLDKEIKVELQKVAQSPASESILSWFHHVLDRLEEGKPHLAFATFSAPPEIAGANAADADVEIEAAADAIDAAVIEEADEVLVDTADEEYTADPEAEDEVATVDVSDDETLASDESLVGEEVADIGEINFLETAAAETTTEAVADPAPAKDETESTPRGFKRPSFLNKKG